MIERICIYRGGGGVDGFFARVDAARDVGQRHVAGVMRRDTLGGGVEEEGKGWKLRSVIRQVGIHIYRVVKSIGVSVSPCIL